MLAPAIPNDAERRVAGQRIGSGRIEKGVDVALLNDAWDRLIPPDLTAQQLPAF